MAEVSGLVEGVPAQLGPVRLLLEGPILTLYLEDLARRNTFSRELMEGILWACKTAEEDLRVRVLVVAGLPDLFCAGGSKDELLRFASGAGRFDEDDFFRAFLRTPVPVISAMQGHAIGGGLVFGFYADVVVMADRSIYAANFMRYGFTPGMGATYLLPAKLGSMLGTEMLLSGRNYRGADLARRGATARIVPHGDVMKVALELARDMAQAPRASLTLLKRELAEPVLAASTRAIEHEVKMHETSFRLPEVKAHIAALYATGGKEEEP